ncbi:class I SAM-dependent methyltransferase [Mycobacterium spongiae]|uniref:Methyltransferase domain-containing protein n=1 Tax=Mycobacterium spongiae TaxID=886343 RepID=A0A975JYW3_9MYCO|nr:class I SAM-dependent methyltransferase [Mycobacterium spongiae]QUR68256.1 methyltransferase domain-containing protein [Mycobacterium spongiae]
MDNLPLEADESTQLAKQAMTRRFYTRSVVKGEITLPAVPAMIDEYVTMCGGLFAGVGRKFSDDELARLREVLEGQLAEAYATSQRSSIVITYNAPMGSTLHYQVRAQWRTVAQEYEHWISTREPPLFGTEPDAKVVALANEAADPTGYRVLDIGAGTGRNALALARRGHPVDVVEMTPKFAEMIRAEAERDSLDVRVIMRDVFSTVDDLRRDYALIVLSEVVPDFRTVEQLRSVFELAAQCLAPDGRLVFNAFLANGDYTPDQAAREFGQQMYTGMCTRREVSTAAAGLPLQIIADDSVPDYEKAHLPDGAWPHTSWYADWASGLDVFTIARDKCPIELRWLVFQKTRPRRRDERLGLHRQ